MLAFLRYLKSIQHALLLTVLLIVLLSNPGCSSECLLRDAVVLPQHLDYLLPGQQGWRYVYDISVDTNRNRFRDSLVRLTTYIDSFNVDTRVYDLANTDECTPELYRIFENTRQRQIYSVGEQRIQRVARQNHSMYSLWLEGRFEEALELQYGTDSVVITNMSRSVDTAQANRLLRRTFVSQLAVNGQTYDDVLVLETQPDAFRQSILAFDSLCFARGVGLVYLKFKCCPAERIPRATLEWSPNVLHSIQLRELIR
jgi:hypothetical protein